MKLICPTCGNGKFRTRISGNVIIQNAENETYNVRAPIGRLWEPNESAYCTSCTWNGPITEVVNETSDIMRRIKRELERLEIDSEVADLFAIFTGRESGPTKLGEMLSSKGYSLDATEYDDNLFFWIVMGVSEKDWGQIQTSAKFL